ncbi:ABC transporter permease [Spiroplasma endosymbiont of Cantharis lateralis]|uniref:ABC transporter permease n=1 Tax=Spiroplasma endosymbiont of Cantharis lateralis TaxID=3066277 RepID=UPI00313CD50F
MLLFKNGLRKLLKDYIQFGIYLVLITIAVIFTSTFGIVSSNLIGTNNNINRNFEKFDYSFRYTSSAYKSNDTQTFTPWFAFNTELVEDKSGNFFPTLRFGENEILKRYEFIEGCDNYQNQCYESSIFEDKNKKHINFHFGDVESNLEINNSNKKYLPNENQAITNFTIEQKIEVVRKAEFGDLYKFNKKAKNFENSLIGELYKKHNYFEDKELTEDAKKTALNIFEYMFYLNNSVLTDIIKKDIIEIYNNSDNKKEEIELSINKGIGFIDKNNNYIFSLIEPKLNGENDIQENNLLKERASFYIKKFDSKTLFKTSYNINGYQILSNNITHRDWFINYFSLLGNLSNFKVRSTNEAVKWDSSGKKFRYISAFYNTLKKDSDSYNVHFYNDDIFNLYKKTYREDSFTSNSFVVSNGYAKYNKMELGKSYDINLKNNKGSYVMDGIGVDSLNVYPTIYEEDLLTDQKNEAIFYISNSAFEQEFNKDAGETSYQDVSRTYLTYENSDKKNMDNDIKLFQTYFADNVLNLGKITEKIENKDYSENLSRSNIESYNDTTLVNMRSSLFPGVVKAFYSLAIVFCIIFASALAFVVYNIFKRVLASQRSQIGNLKALGVSNSKIIINYILYMTFPILILVPIGWFISLFLQGSLIGIFERYFNIPSVFLIDWKLLLVELFSFLGIVSLMVFFTSYFTVKQSPLILLAPSKSHKPNIFLSKSFSKIKGISFTSKLRLVILSTAIKDLVVFFTILLFSSSVITLASVAPNTMKNMSNEFYKSIKYNNDFTYSKIVVNNPITRYSFYQMDEDNKSKSNLEASLFNTFIKVKEEDYRTLLEVDIWKGDNGLAFKKNFEDILFNNLLPFKGAVLSTGVMDELVKIESEIIKNDKIVEKNFNNISCQVIPTLFGQAPISDINDYNDCIKSVSNNILPSTIKELWDKDDKEFKNFSFNFSTISVDKELDQMYTRVESTIDNNNQAKYTVYGLDLIEESSKNLLIKNENKIKYNSSLDYIPVLINKKGELEGLKVGNEFNLKTSQNLLATVGENSSINELDSSLWKFKDKNLFEMDLDKFTYAINHDFYFKNGSIYEPYYNMADIQLSLPKKLLNQELFDEVNDEYQQYSNKDLNSIYREDSDNYIVNPFDIYKYEDGVPTEIGIETLLGGTNSWLNIALKKGLLVNKIVDSAPRKAKVVGVEELYDGNKLYMDQLYANELMGVKEGFDTRREFENGSSVNIWSNAKMSSNIQNADQMQRILLSPFNANNATDGFAKYMDQSIGYTDYIQMKKMAMSNLITSVISISVIFVSLSLITAIIIIYLITEMFIGRYKRFMSYMRIQGYSMREINSIIMWIFLPIAAIGVALGITIIWLLISYLVPQILLSLDIAVPMIMGWTIMPIVFIVGLAIFLLGYTVIMLSIRRVKLASLIGNE